MSLWLTLISITAALLGALIFPGIEAAIAQQNPDAAVIGAIQNRLDPAGMSWNQNADREEIDCQTIAAKKKTAVILTFGQSLAGNSGDVSGIYVPDSGVYNFNFFDQKCYVARDPLLGTTKDGANFATRLGDLLVRRHIYDSVVLFPIAHGGTFVADWAPGGSMHPRLVAALERAKSEGLIVTLALWHQGEAESAFKPDSPSWQSNFHRMVASIRSLGMIAPIYVSQSTLCGPPRGRTKNPNEVIRAAQRAVVDEDGIRAGPDTDIIGIEDRWDGCHYSLRGLDRAAQQWFEAIVH